MVDLQLANIIPTERAVGLLESDSELYATQQYLVVSDKCEPVSVPPKCRKSGRAALTPLGEGGGAVDLEDVAA